MTKEIEYLFPRFLSVTPLREEVGEVPTSFLADLDLDAASKTAEDQDEQHVAIYELSKVFRVDREPTLTATENPEVED